MGLKGLFYAFLALGLGTAVLYYLCPCRGKGPDIPNVQAGWWGKGDRSNYTENKSIRKFTIKVEDKVLQELKSSLKSTVYPEPLENSKFEYGFNTDYLKQVVKYWANDYDWRKHEVRLNSLANFKTQIDGLDVHFMHVKPKAVPAGVRVLPLILVHGWPGSVVEFLDIIPMLTTPVEGRDFVFEVICPSIPGYGFSEAPHQMGFGPIEAAYTFDQLMQRLGFNSYYVEGGDWGAIIVKHMSVLFPQRVKGVHVTVIFSSGSPSYWFKLTVGHFFPSLVVSEHDYPKLYPLGEKFVFILREMGYLHIQATRPDTVGLGLRNSPAGLAAYILEKFAVWTDTTAVDHQDGLLTKKFTLDQLLTNVMVYYVTGTITSSVRFYKENFKESQQKLKMDQIPAQVPAGVAIFPAELAALPENFVLEIFPRLVSYNEMPRGGHFAAFEEPRLLADDIWQFVGKVEKLPKNHEK